MSLTLVEKHRSFGGEHCKYSHFSEVLQCKMTFSIYLPSNNEKKKIPLIWWLSGLTCTDDNFSHKSGFQRLADKYQAAFMIPDTSPRGEEVPDDPEYNLGQGAGFYVNASQEPWAKHYKMYTYIIEELSAIAATLVPHFSGKESIMGHSMGGHGALVIGLKNAARFKSISAFAPIMSPSHTPWGQRAFSAYLGDDRTAWKEWDASELIKEGGKPPILIMQGTEDEFYPIHLDETYFLKNAQEHHQLVDYKKAEGYDHSYYFVATFLEEHIAFHMKHLK